MIVCFTCIGCALNPTNPQINPSNYPIASVQSTIAPSPFPLPPTPSFTPSSTPILINQICSPLQGETLSTLSKIITQPFIMPPLGFDYDHQGVDFSYYRRNGRIGIQGLPVYASLEGKVISVLRQKQVYGNAIIIETQVDQMQAGWLSNLHLPEIAPTVIPNQRLTCPIMENGPNIHLNVNKRSLYLLYAHLEHPPTFKIGDKVKCGQQIGTVGNSGKSTNPHLHVEVRIGPSGAVFEGLAHYDASASELERYNYCTWRVSNLFELTDPMNLFNLQR